jgi:hypothetical protein
MTTERAEFLERHYTLSELEKAWHMSRKILREWFIEEPGVVKFGTAKLIRGRKRTNVQLRIPESVARRVYRRRTGQEVYPAQAS